MKSFLNQQSSTTIVYEETGIPTEKTTIEPLRVVIVDDVKKIRDSLLLHIHNIFPQELTVVGEAFSVESALKVIQTAQPDLVFLDIEIIGGTGFDVLDELPTIDFSIIFVTSFAEFGATAFRYNAIDYILKPINVEHFEEAVRRVLALRNRSLPEKTFVASTPPSSAVESPPPQETQQNWTVRTNDRTMYVLEWQDIIRLQADGKHTFVHCGKDAPLHLAKTLQECLSELPESLFYQTHRSHVINLTHFSHARGYFAFLSNGDRVDVAIRSWKKFLSDMENGA